MPKILREPRIALAILLCVVYIGYQFYQRKRDADALREETLREAVPTVAITHARPIAPTATISLPGNIDAWYQAPIYAQIPGYVKMWYKDYGARVKQGEVLAEISQPTLDAEFSQAKADLESQRAKYNLALVSLKRWLALRESHAVSEQSISVQEANERSEAAQVKAAENNVNNFLAKMRFKTIVAPYDGVVTQRNVNVGDYINKDGYISSTNGNTVSNLFSVADIHKMRLFISVPSTLAEILKPGLTADVVVPQYTNRHFTANFLTAANGIDPNTRTIVTEFTIDNEDGALWPGSYATVTLTVPNDTHILSIPASALVFQEANTQVAVVTDDDRIHFKPIQVSKILDGTVEFTEGVTPNERIVNNPSAALLEGDKVRIVKPAPGYDLSGEDGPPGLQEAASPTAGQ
ncbi:efflux RND transporter periplasmic adaptor subunit [Methylococcus capsulatus]|uniref:efflux RND transporter periplasmic adaptor subunit n=1 Tax=Methylococcus capsulatus TaxID=414 RepID=UPI001C52AF1B|nr:efflux RND transporter periplasmic adaptor subunit [Methylococcus capsulatus]QXP89449.1 efflux RND transporter periplasmic adaptor subunit [Methylococcus capsulatus]